MAYLSSLSLHGFRNYDTCPINDLNNGFVVLVGENGAGKTNCLEAISILSPGRGLRGASVMDCQSQSTQSPWAITSQITDQSGDIIHLGVGRNPEKPTKKIVRADGNTLKSQAELGEILRTIWLTPQMDGLFLQSSSERRRFLDRLVATFDPAHTGRMARIEKATRERLNLLKSHAEKNTPLDTAWLNGLENIMAETSIAIAAARIDTLTTLSSVIDTKNFDNFPKATLSLNGDIERMLQNKSALATEDFAKEQFQSSRMLDGQTGRTNFGINRCDLTAIYSDKNMPAGQCSTGEQKALLTTIILAHADMVAKRYGAPPVLLFDEMSAHFDPKKRDALFEILNNMQGQVWLTGQDSDTFSSIQNKQSFTIKKNQLTHCE